MIAASRTASPSSNEVREDDARHIAKLLVRIAKWTERNATQEFKDFKRKQLANTLADERERNIFEIPKEFIFKENVEKEHNAIMSFYDLNQSANTLAQCEYYFRRFPFKGMPVLHHEHLRNICELYFSMFYVIKNRLESVLNAFNAACPTCSLNVGAFIKKYNKEFDQEIRERNSVHHTRPFEDRAIDKIMLTKLMSTTDDFKGKGWDREHISAYRKLSNEWAERVKRRNTHMLRYIDAVAKAILNHAPFLNSDENHDCPSA